MPKASYPYRVVGGVPVVTAPAELGIGTAGQLRAALLEAATGGHGTVVLDMTGTRFCDSVGLEVLARAHRRALAEGGELRLIVPVGSTVFRVFALTGVDHLIPHFATLERALATAPTAVAGSPRRDARAGSVALPPWPPAGFWEHGPVADTRVCEQCLTVFVPQREHARFCSVGCRAAWNRAHLGDPAVEASALAWSVTAMREAAGRLAGLRAWDRPGALTAIGEAVWWITMVDGTLVRHHLTAYETVLAGQGAGERLRTEETLAGLRFVRNQSAREAGLDELIDAASAGRGRRVTSWAWKPAPEPELGSLPARGRAWEMTRYRAYHTQLVGSTIGQIFRRAVSFLALTGASAASPTQVSADAPPRIAVSSQHSSSDGLDPASRGQETLSDGGY